MSCRKEHRRRIVSFVITITVCIFVFSKAHRGQEEKQPHTGPDLPAVADIDYIVVELYDCPWNRPDLGPFVLPKESYEKILAQFTPAVRDEHPILMYGECGTLHIVLKSGKHVRFSWYWYQGKALLPFSFQGMRFRRVRRKDEVYGDQALYLDGLIRNAHEKQSAPSEP